jgi:hypothetical protein
MIKNIGLVVPLGPGWALYSLGYTGSLQTLAKSFIFASKAGPRMAGLVFASKLPNRYCL